jgi:hypothetical protein
MYMYCTIRTMYMCTSRWLSRLKNSVDFTVPLYKWDASCLQSSYYTSIKVDPLVSIQDCTCSICIYHIIPTLYIDITSLARNQGGHDFSFISGESTNYIYM